MHLSFKTEHGWSGAYTKFIITCTGFGTIEREINCTNGMKQKIMIEKDYVEYFDGKSELSDIYFNCPLPKTHSVKIHIISNEILSDLRYSDSFVFAFNDEKFSILFQKDRLYIFNKNSFKFKKDYKLLDLSSEKKFLTSVNNLIIKHCIETETQSINHFVNRINIQNHNFRDLSKVYEEVIKRKYYG